MSLRKATIRLAYERPELRAHLLPLLARTAAPLEDEEAMNMLAGRPWGGTGYKSKAKDYDDPSPGPGTPPCTPEGEGGCYDSHPGSPPAGANGSAARRKYNEWYRSNVEGV
jgi:hypothetical protein